MICIHETSKQAIFAEISNQNQGMLVLSLCEISSITWNVQFPETRSKTKYNIILQNISYIQKIRFRQTVKEQTDTSTFTYQENKIIGIPTSRKYLFHHLGAVLIVVIKYKLPIDQGIRTYLLVLSIKLIKNKPLAVLISFEDQVDTFNIIAINGIQKFPLGTQSVPNLLLSVFRYFQTMTLGEKVTNKIMCFMWFWL